MNVDGPRAFMSALCSAGRALCDACLHYPVYLISIGESMELALKEKLSAFYSNEAQH